MTVAVILVVSWQSGRRPSGHHEVGPGLSANRKLARNGLRGDYSPPNRLVESRLLALANKRRICYALARGSSNVHGCGQGSSENRLDALEGTQLAQERAILQSNPSDSEPTDRR